MDIMPQIDIEPSLTNRLKKLKLFINLDGVIRRPTLRLISSIIILLLLSRTASGQAVSTGNLIQITAAADSFNINHPTQKIHLQFDKPYYAIGDTIWFKAYLVNAAYLKPADKTGICYIEVVDADNKAVKRMMLPITNGLSWGNIALDENDIPGGSYTIRAYTRYMCNFGDDYIFKKNFYFFNTGANGRLVNEKVALSKDNGIETAHIGLQFYGLDKGPLILKDMRLNVTDRSKILLKKDVRTKIEGALDVDLALKSSPKHLALAFTDVGKDAAPEKMLIPVVFNRPENTDVQFMPEGGNLVAGLPAHIGFKAVGEDGHAVDIEGNILDSKQQPIAAFKSTHSGMGAFDMIPLAGETYTANATLPGGLVKTYPLATVKSIGTVLKVRAVDGADSLAITITGTQVGSSYYLIGRSREIICYAAVVTLNNGAAKVKIPDKAFPTGIARFTLLNADRQALNERIIFINHQDNLQIVATPDKLIYGGRDSVSMKIHITNKDGFPVKGSFSIAVTDDAQVETDSLKGNNIISDLLLTSDLKGNVEEPGYYFQADTNGSIKQQLDNLLLTQGWVGYDWKDVFGPEKPVFYPDETNFVINGSVSNAFKKPVANSAILLMSRKPSFVLDTVSDASGHFTFKNITPVDTPAYFLQARNKNGRSFNIDLKVDEFKPPVFSPTGENITPWYVNSDTNLLAYVKNNITNRKEQEKFMGNGHLLKEVNINAKKIIKGSQNLNGPGNADIIIDEQELEKAGKKSFLQLLQEHIKGFREGVFNKVGDAPEPPNTDPPTFITDGHGSPHFWYFIEGKPVKFIIDGISVTKILGGDGFVSPFTFLDITDYLSSQSAEDIKGIEVMKTANFAAVYVPVEYTEHNISPSDYAFVEITTRSGNGPNIGFTPGSYLYKPLPFSLPKQFYSPRYPVKNKDMVTDYRSTIYWKPDVTTNSRGNAFVSFYTAAKPGRYSVIIEGCTGNGLIGSRAIKIKVNGK
jgi:hypothetical protein